MPCPTCFLTRATELALRGDLQASLQQHAFGPLAALGLLAWSLLALRQRQLWPRLALRWQPRWLLAAAVVLVGYWFLRLQLQAFPGTLH